MLSAANIDISYPDILLDQRFSDIEQMASAVGWDIDFRQTEAGALDARALLLGTPECIIFRIEFNRGYHQKGTPPPGFLSFGLPDISTGILRSQGKIIEAGALLNFNGGRKLDVSNNGPLSGYIVGFSDSLLRRVIGILDLDFDLQSGLEQWGYWLPVDHEIETLRGILRTILGAAKEGDGSALREYQEAFDFEIAAQVVRIISGPMNSPAVGSPPFRQRTLQAALEILEDADSAGISVSRLCTLCNASLATLERAFLDEFGVTPKFYIRALRLAGVKKELVRIGSGASISNVANTWGFWHMGSFAADYFKQFGELPSQTILRIK
jgi:AraC family ethanolamine operon transcriptional activator